MRITADMNDAQVLRALAARGQYGHPRSVDNFYMSEDYTSYYWECPEKSIISHERWQRLARLSKRYREFVTHCREVIPQWKYESTIHFADNSVEEVQVATAGPEKGKRRNVMVTAPSGDACF